MHIVISGAWPEPEIGKELAAHIEKQAPTLARWLASGSAQIIKSNTLETKCLPLENWLLQACNFTPDSDQNISAGLGPLLHNVDDDEQVWLADMVHMSPSRDGAALLTAPSLQIDEHQAKVLLDDSLEFFTENNFKFSPTDKPYTWRIHWPEPIKLNCASPSLVATSSVNDWWPEEHIARPWRVLANSLQMAWYEHPVNLERQNQGLPPINSMWLYGGAKRSQLKGQLPADTHINTDLHNYLMVQDWGGWINQLTQLESELFTKLDSKRFNLILTGREKYVDISVKQNLLSRFKPHNWRHWWSSL